MRGRESGGILHVGLEIPELLKPYPANVHNVVALRNRRLGMRSVDSRAQWYDVSRQRLVERKEAKVLRGDLGRGCESFGKLFFVRGNILRVERRNLKQKNRNTALVASSEPLGVLESWSVPGSAAVGGLGTKRRVCSNSSTSMVRNRSSMPCSFRQSSVSLNCLKASWGTKRRARK